MRPYSSIGAWIVGFCLMMLCTSAGQAAPQSCHDFIHGFYAWYAPSYLRPWWRAIDERPRAFNAELLSLLRRDKLAKRHAQNIVGLDFDPFFGTQGKFKGYNFDRIVVRGAVCRAPLHLDFNGERSPVPNAVPEMTLIDSRWQITNVFYPAQKQDLIRLLKSFSLEYESVERRT